MMYEVKKRRVVNTKIILLFKTKDTLFINDLL